jgi:hypothetical protein
MRQLLCLALLVGCSTNPAPENNLDLVRRMREWAQGYGCNNPNAGEALARATSYRGEHGPQYRPEVGWDACELMFTLGYPSKEEFQETETGKYRSWWYDEYSSVHLVNLTLRPEQASPTRSPWVVTYVGW